MYFNEIEIENYKCFKNKVSLQLEKGVNLIIGKNNVGKTALLEAVSLEFPLEFHRSIETFPKEKHPPISNSKVTVTFTVEKDELIDLILWAKQRGEADFNLPYDKDWKSTINSVDKDELGKRMERAKRITFAKNYFSSQTFTLKLQREAYDEKNGQWYVPDDSYVFPEIQREEENDGVTQHYVTFQVDYSNKDFDFKEIRTVSGGGKKYREDFSKRIANELYQYIFRFQALRFPSEPCKLGHSRILQSDCRNLAEVLNLLLGRNPFKFNELNNLVRQILPNIFQVSVRTGYENFGLENEARVGQVIIWNAENQLQHPQLAKTLDKIGSGVGQVIAILYVLLTSDEPQVLLIDEPQSFLHPDALRKLIEVLRFYAEKYQHQIIIATHSPTVITAADARTVTLIRQIGSESTLENIDIHEIDKQKIFLSEIGARFSDVFGFDRIIWVEGETEEECFPKIAGKLQPLLGTAILRVKNTGDFDSKNKNFVERIVSIYERLSKTNNGLVPTTVDFIFDKEVRSNDAIKQLKKLGRRMQNRQCVHFIDKRMYENYLINCNAIESVINEIDEIRDHNITVEEIDNWIEANKHKKEYYKNKKLPEDIDLWKNEIHAKEFLKDLFAEFIKTDGLPYIETIHSVKLTEWILENSPNDLKDICELITGIMKLK